MASKTDSSKHAPSQENLLLDYFQRLEKHKKDRKIVHLHLSALRPFNRREQHIRTAANSFEGFVANLSGQIFVLKNADIFFIYKNEIHVQVETIVQRVRFLFNDDPLIAEEHELGQSFADWYDAEADFDTVFKLVQTSANAEEKRRNVVRSKMDSRAALRAKQEEGEPLTPSVLARVETALERADLSNLVRRQFVCEIDDQMVPTELFSELFISIKDLRETMLPGVNLLANRWLFQHLTETLDKRMLAMLKKTDGIPISGDISFNINVATLLSKEFEKFDDTVAASRRGTMIIELQKEDIFSNLPSYTFAREFVHDRGYKICLDGMTLQTINMIRHERLHVNMVKLVWHPELVDGGDPVRKIIQSIVDRRGSEYLILCRCDNREAIDFGRSAGINYFQGRYVESMIAEDARRRELLRLKRRIERSDIE